MRSNTPTIHKNKGKYHLKVPARYVKNKRLLETSFDKKLTAVIDKYLQKRDLRLKERKATSTLFILGYDGSSELFNMLVTFTYKAQKVLWPEREFITWGFNPHALRHFAATVYLADNPNDIYRCAELLQDLPQTVIDNYIEPDRHGIANHHSTWASQYF